MIPLHYRLFSGDITVNTSVVAVSFVFSRKAIDQEFLCAMIDISVKTCFMIQMSTELDQRASGKERMS